MSHLAAARALCFEGVVVEDVAFAGRTVAAVAVIDWSEHRRRTEVGLGAIADRDVVDALWLLPENQAVKAADLDPIAAAFLDGAPGAVEWDEQGIRRVVRPALRVTGVLVSDRRWRRGLSSVGVFAANAARALVLPRRVDAAHAGVLEGQRLGIGIVSVAPHAEAIVVAWPARPVVRAGPRQWRFEESVYDAWLRQTAVMSAV